MILSDVVKRFEKQAPMCVMARAALENVLAESRLNAMFEATAERGENKTLMFSTVADIMGLVACRIHPSVHAAYQSKADEVGVTAKALYDKLQRVERGVSRQMVRETAAHMAQIIEKTGGALPELLSGYRVKIVDGNHLRRTQRRIQELSKLNAAPLPGHCAVVLDPRLKLVIDAIPCEDGHAQERTLLPELLETVERRDLWIADRNFCTLEFLLGIRSRRAYFVIRQHGNLPYVLVGRRRKVGRCQTGMVYEQSMLISGVDGQEVKIRRVTIKLDSPTRDGDTEIHVLTNLPHRVGGLKVAELYQKRWTIETAFGEVAQNLEGEIETLGYPRAALFAFCMALVAYNLLSVLRAALRAAHGVDTIEEGLSIYYVCDEVAATSRGMMVAVPEDYWQTAYANLTPAQLARELVRIARLVNLSRYRKHKRGPKKPTQNQNKKRRNHVSTARVLAER
jgi:IS4 transposase